MKKRLLRLGAGMLFFISSFIYLIAMMIQFPIWLITGKTPFTSIFEKLSDDLFSYVNKK